jgi:hypothetical protein
MCDTIEETNRRAKFSKKQACRNITKKDASLCCDFLAMFNYRLLAIFKMSIFRSKFYRNSFMALAINRFGKKCFLLLTNAGYNRWFMLDIDYKKIIAPCMQSMIDNYCNLFLKNSKDKSSYLLLPNLFTDKVLTNQKLTDDSIPKQLNQFRSAQQN